MLGLKFIHVSKRGHRQLTQDNWVVFTCPVLCPALTYELTTEDHRPLKTRFSHLCQSPLYVVKTEIELLLVSVANGDEANHIKTNNSIYFFHSVLCWMLIYIYLMHTAMPGYFMIFQTNKELKDVNINRLLKLRQYDLEKNPNETWQWLWVQYIYRE